MTNENIRIRHVVQRSLDIVFPLTMVYMCYIILHGHLSPGGGFQGGVLVVGVILMLYFAEGHRLGRLCGPCHDGHCGRRPVL